MKIITDKNLVDNLLTRGVEDIIVADHLREALLSGKKLRIKLGIDPTAPSIHLGRTIPLKKLRDFQNLGHQAVIIIGDFTTQIGDPSDKLEKRPMLDIKTIKRNMRDYKKIIGKIIDIKNAEFHYNSKWLKKLNFQDIGNLAESFSVQQMSARRNFKDRIEKGIDISLREFLYPLMQGYDSVATRADVELGGFDQLFNLKAGRVIQKHFEMREQDILTTQMIEGTDGRKMSSSWGNVIYITDEPDDMYGKIMSLDDSLTIKYFLLLTRVSEVDIKNIEQGLASGQNPKSYKMQLAREIVSLYHGGDKAKSSEEKFIINTFQKKEVPDDILEIKATSNQKLVDVLLKENIISSKSEFRRLIEQDGVHNLDSKKSVTSQDILGVPATYRIGKRRFVRIINE